MVYLHSSLGAHRRRHGQSGFSLVELIVAFSILLVLSSMAVPLARSQVRRERERDLRLDLREMRTAIDKYKDMCDSGKLQTSTPEENCYPKSLQILVDGVSQSNKVAGLNQSTKIRFLRRISKDPFTGDTDWGQRSMQDDPTSTSWGGQNVFDVYTKSMDKASDGTGYSDW